MGEGLIFGGGLYLVCFNAPIIDIFSEFPHTEWRLHVAAELAR